MPVHKTQPKTENNTTLIADAIRDHGKLLASNLREPSISKRREEIGKGLILLGNIAGGTLMFTIDHFSIITFSFGTLTVIGFYILAYQLLTESNHDPK